MWTQKNIQYLTVWLLELSFEEGIAFELHGIDHVIAMYCPESLTQDKCKWLKRKRNATIRFRSSTWDLFEKNQGNEEHFLNKYGLENSEFTLTPGSVPVFDSEGFFRGVVTITGKSPQEDHELAIRACLYLESLD